MKELLDQIEKLTSNRAESGHRRHLAADKLGNGVVLKIEVLKPVCPGHDLFVDGVA